MQSQHVGNQFASFLKSGSLLSVLFIMNVAVWLLMLLMPLVDYLYTLPSGSAKSGWIEWLALSSEWGVIVRKPWTLLTHMFLHDGFWQLLFNMLLLYFGGTMCCRYLGTRRFGWLYFGSGIAGALFYLLVYNLFPVGKLQISSLLGASAAVLGILVAVAVYVPNQEVSLWLVRRFNVKLKWFVTVVVIIDLLSISSSNAGWHIAHIGGALFGWLFVLAMRARSGRTPRPVKTKKRKPSSTSSANANRPLSDEDYNYRRANDQKRVDAILDKISRSGYENLTKEEKEFLFKFK